MISLTLRVDAANDAHSGLAVFRKLLSIAAEKELETDTILKSVAVRISSEAAAKPAKASSKGKAKAVEPAKTLVDIDDETALVEAALSLEETSLPQKTMVAVPQPNSSGEDIPKGIRPCNWRAYRMWFSSPELDLDGICARYRSLGNPLTRKTVM